MKKLISLILMFVFLFACKKEKLFDGLNFYQDSFERYISVGDLFPENDTYWSFKQLTQNENSHTLDTIRSKTGFKSLKCSASKSRSDDASKASVVKQNMAYWEGETMRVSAWYYLEGTKPINWLFIMDIEEQVNVGAGPGMRLAIVNNQLRVEHKFLEDDILQNIGGGTDFPRDEWVEIVFEIKLSQKNKGTVKLWQNSKLIIDTKENRTLPKDLLYAQQGTKGMYSSIEVGITANTQDSEVVLWVDDVKFEKIK